jgi:hypothetical protein
MARREERRKAKRCKGPPAEYLDLTDKDPDRQQLNKLPIIPAMNPATGLREHVPVYACKWRHGTIRLQIDDNFQINT